MTVGADPSPVAIHHGQCTAGQPRVRPITRRAAVEALTLGWRPAHCAARSVSSRSTEPRPMGMHQAAQNGGSSLYSGGSG
ncbi:MULTISPECIES: DUF6233 domain-containing protein [Streptomyces]|uniref:DUF6233 domain-containing protein n=1 Tax=Streptomyces TaxID=1883 RepID=UPI0034333240